VRAGRVLRGLAGHQWSPELEKETLWVGPFLKKNVQNLFDPTFFEKY
jgi:hypothetical protein